MAHSSLTDPCTSLVIV